MNMPLLHSDTAKQLNSFINNPNHALLITGAKGSGKSFSSQWVATQILTITPEKLINYPYALFIKPDEKNSIKIEKIREIDHFISRKVPKVKTSISRIIFIDDADLMTLAAQNALLKNLEEPPKNTLFLLTATNTEKLLATIKSRTTLIRIIKPDTTDIARFLETTNIDPRLITQIINVSDGSLATAIEIARDSENHPLIKAAKLARELLSENRYTRLTKVNELVKDKDLVMDTLQIIQNMAQVSLKSASNEQAKRWHQVLNAAYNAKEDLLDNTNIKLTLIYLMNNL